MIINIKCTGMELTSALRQYAEEKVESLVKYFDNIQQADIDIGVRNHHHQKGKIFYAEVNLFVPGRTLRVVKDAEELYKAIDKVRDHLKVEFEKMKGKMRRKDRKVLREVKGYQDE